MKKLKLVICKKSEGHDYGHSDERVKKYENLLKEIELFFDVRELKYPDNKIIGAKVSNSGCNIWLIIWHHNQENEHTIHTTQNNSLGKFGLSLRKTDLQRFIK